MTAFNLDPEIEAFIEEYLEISGNLSASASIAQQRHDYEKICQHFRYPHPVGVTIRDSQVRGRHGDIRVRHYHCQQQGAAQMIFLHGGGFILGSLDSHDDVCAELCAAGEVDAVSIDYRLSPEHTHPVHLDDVVDAYLAVQKGKSVIVGISAGATLAAALCHRLKNNPQKPQGQVLIYPSLGGELFDLKSYIDNAHAPLLCNDDIGFYRKARCGEGEIPVRDPEFYPLSAQDFGGLPRTIAFSADIDPLRDDARFYVEQISTAGGEAKQVNEEGLVHDYIRARHMSKKARDSFRRIGEAIKALAYS